MKASEHDASRTSPPGFKGGVLKSQSVSSDIQRQKRSQKSRPSHQLRRHSSTLLGPLECDYATLHPLFGACERAMSAFKSRHCRVIGACGQAPRPAQACGVSGSPRSACVGAGMLPPPTHQGREKFVRKHAYFHNACERFHRPRLVSAAILPCVLACSILQEFSPWQLQSTPPFNRI